MDVSQINAGKLKTEKNNFNINDLLVHIASVAAPKAHAKGLDLIYDIDHSVPSVVTGDVVRLGQIFIHLVENAIKHSQTGTVKLQIDTMKKHYENKIGFEFKVIDEGIGIDKEMLPGLFKNASHLNMYIIKHLVDAMDGTIDVKSIQGAGTEFTIQLYLAKAKVNDRRYYRLPSKELMYKNVIVIGEEYHTNKSLVNMFGYFRHDVKLANNMEVAGRMLTQSACDILVIDEVVITTQLMQQLEPMQQEYNFKIVYLSNTHKQSSSSDEFVITKPFSQGMIFNLILNLFDDELRAKEQERAQDFIEEELETPPEYKELDLQQGLQNCDMNEDTYNRSLDDFIDKYENAGSVLQGMIDEEKYSDAAEFIQDLKELAAHLGGKKLVRSASDIEKVFTQKSYNKLPVLTNLFGKTVENLIQDIKTFKEAQAVN